MLHLFFSWSFISVIRLDPYRNLVCTQTRLLLLGYQFAFLFGLKKKRGFLVAQKLQYHEYLYFFSFSIYWLFIWKEIHEDFLGWWDCRTMAEGKKDAPKLNQRMVSSLSKRTAAAHSWHDLEIGKYIYPDVLPSIKILCPDRDEKCVSQGPYIISCIISPNSRT